MLLSPGSDVIGVLMGDKNLDAGEENAPYLCPAFQPELCEALRKIQELPLFIVLEIHYLFVC